MSEFTPGDRVRRAKGTQTGTVTTVALDGARVQWDDGESRWMEPRHIAHVETEETTVGRWEMPVEPELGAVVAGRNSVWKRRKNGAGWHRVGSDQTSGWSMVLTDAPLVRLVPADEPVKPDADTERDALLRTVDGLRDTLARYRGTPALRDAAKELVLAETYSASDKERSDLRRRLWAALDTVDEEGRDTSTRAGYLRRDVVRNARHVLDKVSSGAAPSDAELEPALDALRYAMADLDEHLMSPSGDAS